MEIAISQEIKSESLTLSEQALAIKVISKESMVEAGMLGKAIKALRDKIIAHYKPIKQAMDESKKKVLDMEKADLKGPLEAISIIDDAVNTFTREQERLRKIEQDRVDKIEADRVAKEKEKLLAQAIKAEAKGKGEKAEELLEKAENVYQAPITVESAVAKTVKTEAGKMTQTVELQVDVLDMKAFVTELVKRNLMPTMLEAKTAPLKAWIKANGFESFPGLRINKTTKVRY